MSSDIDPLLPSPFHFVQIFVLEMHVESLHAVAWSDIEIITFSYRVEEISPADIGIGFPFRSAQLQRPRMVPLYV